MAMDILKAIVKRPAGYCKLYYPIVRQGGLYDRQQAGQNCGGQRVHCGPVCRRAGIRGVSQHAKGPTGAGTQ